MNVILIGPPGSGKGTISDLMVKRKFFYHVSTGDIFREAISENSSLTKEINQYVKSGELVPDKIVVNIVKNYLPNLIYKGNLVFDGFPRNINQAKIFDKDLFNLNSKINYVIYLKIDDSKIIERLSARRICPKCGKIYNLIQKKPLNDNLCDKCKIPLIQRGDDKVGVILARLKIFQKTIKQLLNYYQKQNKLVIIKAHNNLELNYKNIIDKIFAW